jgi:hypothetical protein
VRSENADRQETEQLEAGPGGKIQVQKGFKKRLLEQAAVEYYAL